LFENGYTKVIEDKLKELNIEYDTFSGVQPDPTLENCEDGLKQMREFKPDTIIAIGGGSPMDAAKVMWLMYEHPEVDFYDLAMRFMDIRKRIYTFPKMGEKVYFIAIPTSSGTGSEVSPFAVITDGATGQKYPLADYELMPNMAIVDVNVLKDAPKGLTAASGVDAITHDIEAYASMMATPFTDGLVLKSLKMLFDYLPRAYDNGSVDIEAREMVGTAATMAGMAFANAFLGIGHSLAHKLGAYHHIAHGIACSLMLDHVIRYNAEEVPEKMGTFPEYDHPHALRRYAEIAEALGIYGNNDQEKLDGLIRKIDELKAHLEIKSTIKEYGIDENAFLSTLDEMSENAFDDQCTSSNPRYPIIDDLKKIYLKAYYGDEYYSKYPEN
jgi:acetaldehyde dehydrogenase/alcohol dehydrogenase